MYYSNLKGERSHRSSSLALIEHSFVSCLSQAIVLLIRLTHSVMHIEFCQHTDFRFFSAYMDSLIPYIEYIELFVLCGSKYLFFHLWIYKAVGRCSMLLCVQTIAA